MTRLETIARKRLAQAEECRKVGATKDAERLEQSARVLLAEAKKKPERKVPA